MFSKGNKTRADNHTPGGPVEDGAPSIIGGDTHITSNIVSSGELQIDGRVTGDIKTPSLLVGETAHIQGEVTADTVRVHGQVSGQITAASVILAASAKMIGDINHENLAIEQGAFLEGHCKHVKLSPVPAPAPVAPGDPLGGNDDGADS